MKRLLFAAFLGLLTCLTVHGEEDRFLLFQTDSQSGGGTNQWWLPFSRLKRLPLWKSEKAEPSLSLKKALRKAKKWIGSKGRGGDVDYILLRSINPDEDPYRLIFYYRIELGVAPYGNHMTCIVLMDRTVLEPERLSDR